MALLPIATVQVAREADVAVARQDARRIAALLGFDADDRAEIAAALAAIAQNAITHGGGGHVDFALDDAEASFVMTVSDDGPGIADLDALRAGHFATAAGLFGAWRLTDRLDIRSAASGTRVLLARTLPAGQRIEPGGLVALAGQLAGDGRTEPLDERRMQSRELLQSLGERRDRRTEDALRRDGEIVAAEVTGSIAHDFNNVLQIVTSNLELLGRSLPDDAERLRRVLGNAMEGAQRAVALARRLLDLSRR